MKGLNNKGFAITTLLYGLLSVAFLIMTLLIGVMSTNRQNTSTLVKTIEEELNRYGETETTFAYVGELQEYIVPYGQAGWYKIELWGAKSSSGNGDYASGIVYLEENTTLYFYLGATCSSASACNSAYNKANTEVRVVPTASTQWNDSTSIRSTIMRAGSIDASYVSGMAGMNSVNESGTATNQTNHYSGYYFINGLYIPDSNAGNGMANVELVSTNAKTLPPTKKTTALDSVRYIKVCSEGSNKNTSNHIVEIQAIEFSTGTNLAKGKALTYYTSNVAYATEGNLLSTGSEYTDFGTGNQCTTIDLGSAYTLSEIGVWQYYKDSRTYYNQTVAVSTNNSTWTYLKNTSETNTTSVKESIIGTRFTSWQPNTTTTLPAGNYYIMSTVADNIALTAQNARNVTSPNKANVTTEIFTASKLQKWTIEIVSGSGTSTIYKIYESENLHALQIAEGTAETSENANAAATYRGYAWDQWYIIPQGNGTYKIQSLLGTYLSSSNNSGAGNANMDGGSTSDTTFSNRWKFINAEY